MTRILIAADESEASLEAARTAHRIFGDDASYWMINVGESLVGSAYMWGDPYAVTMPITAYPLETRQEQEQEAERHADEVAAEAEVDATPIGAIGDAASAIVEAAHRHNIDVIVVGSHERNWFGRLFHPSVSSGVVREADIPVLVVK